MSSENLRASPGRYPRGEETKQRIITAAIEIFGRQGFAGTSTRDIAAAAEVNTPAIQYYFGGKLGLYDACIDQLTGKVWDRISGTLHDFESIVEGGARFEDLVVALGNLQDRLIDAFFADKDGHAIRRLLAWEDAAQGTKASIELMKDRIGLPVYVTFRAAVEQILPAPKPPIEIEMHALSLMGLSMIFHFNQSRVMDMLDWTLDEQFLTTFKVVARDQLAYALAGLARR